MLGEVLPGHGRRLFWRIVTLFERGSAKKIGMWLKRIGIFSYIYMKNSPCFFFIKNMNPLIIYIHYRINHRIEIVQNNWNVKFAICGCLSINVKSTEHALFACHIVSSKVGHGNVWISRINKAIRNLRLGCVKLPLMADY